MSTAEELDVQPWLARRDSLAVQIVSILSLNP